MFALEWDKSLLDAPQEGAPAAADADAPAQDAGAPAAPNGRVHQPPPQYDQKSVNLTADKTVRPPLALAPPCMCAQCEHVTGTCSL